MSEEMKFPDTLDEFIKQYSFIDEEQIYTNGSELIQTFRIKQWEEHKKQENQELKKQLEEYEKQLKPNYYDTQQKEFIEYMNKTIEECNNYSKYIEKKTKELHGRSCGKTYIANEIMKNEVAKKILEEILSKYKEITGDDK